MTGADDVQIPWAKLEAGVKSFAALLTAIATCFGIVGGVVYWAVMPRVEDFIDEAVQEAQQPVIQKMDALSDTLERYEQARLDTASVSFPGTPGLVLDKGPFRAGTTVSIGYWMRRLEACQVKVTVRFWDADRNRFATELTYTIPGTPAQPGLDYDLFPISIFLPIEMPPGRYSYRPLLHPEGCRDNATITPPPSLIFEVVA